jgi:hypothetical protein
MYAAVEAVSKGEIGEVELAWSTEDGSTVTRLEITVRREVRQFPIVSPP